VPLCSGRRALAAHRRAGEVWGWRCDLPPCCWAARFYLTTLYSSLRASSGQSAPPAFGFFGGATGLAPRQPIVGPGFAADISRPVLGPSFHSADSGPGQIRASAAAPTARCRNGGTLLALGATRHQGGARRPLIRRSMGAAIAARGWAGGAVRGSAELGAGWLCSTGRRAGTRSTPPRGSTRADAAHGR
jgi:hypothetical protein